MEFQVGLYVTRSKTNLDFHVAVSFFQGRCIMVTALVHAEASSSDVKE
jgi:hypothetical protein